MNTRELANKIVDVVYNGKFLHQQIADVESLVKEAQSSAYEKAAEVARTWGGCDHGDCLEQIAAAIRELGKQ